MISTLHTQILDALAPGIPLTLYELHQACPIATDRRQVSRALHGLKNTNDVESVGKITADDPRNPSNTTLTLYSITEHGRTKIVETPEQQLARKVREAEPIQPWEIFDLHSDHIVKDINALRFSKDSDLFRKSREHAGRLRYLAERMEATRTVEGVNVGKDLRDTADLIDQLVPCDVAP